MRCSAGKTGRLWKWTRKSTLAPNCRRCSQSSAPPGPRQAWRGARRSRRWLGRGHRRRSDKGISRSTKIRSTLRCLDCPGSTKRGEIRDPLPALLGCLPTTEKLVLKPACPGELLAGRSLRNVAISPLETSDRLSKVDAFAGGGTAIQLSTAELFRTLRSIL